jgi:hypothetical protein
MRSAREAVMHDKNLARIVTSESEPAPPRCCEVICGAELGRSDQPGGAILDTVSTRKE